MSYIPYDWKSREGRGLNKYTDESTGQIFTLISTPDEVTQEGTPFSTVRMNTIEQGLANVFDKPETLDESTQQMFPGEITTPDAAFRYLLEKFSEYSPTSTFQQIMTGGFR
jgi:hypothetical protein